MFFLRKKSDNVAFDPTLGVTNILGNNDSSVKKSDFSRKNISVSAKKDGQDEQGVL